MGDECGRDLHQPPGVLVERQVCCGHEVRHDELVVEPDEVLKLGTQPDPDAEAEDATRPDGIESQGPYADGSEGPDGDDEDRDVDDAVYGEGAPATDDQTPDAGSRCGQPECSAERGNRTETVDERQAAVFEVFSKKGFRCDREATEQEQAGEDEKDGSGPANRFTVIVDQQRNRSRYEEDRTANQEADREVGTDK